MDSSHQLDVQIKGSGPPMLLVHGFASCRYTFRYIIDAFCDTYTTFAIDLLGHGDSPKPKGADYSLYRQSELVRDVIDRHGLENVTLIGHSFGGGVSLKVALDELTDGSSRLKNLVLIGSASFAQKFPPFIGVLRHPILGRILPPFVPAKVGAKRALRFAYHNRDRITPEQIEGWAVPNRAKGIRYSMRQTALQILPPNLDELTAKYPSIDLPTLLIWGQQDRVVPLSIGKRLHEVLPDSQLKIVPDCGHVPQEEWPELTIDLLRSFLNKQQH